MNVLVTGGSGRIGHYVVQELIDTDHTVVSIDLVRSTERLGRFLRVDLTNAGEVYQALVSAGAEAVIHLGAWSNWGKVPDTRTFGDNAQGTFNVFQACADLGITRVIFASSAQVYGFAKAPPLYVPVDEDHPLRPTNSYALSKVIGEKTADYFAANFGLTILSLRFMGVRTPAELPPEIQRMAQDPARGSRLLWTRVDVRDAALACRLAIEREDVPPGPYNITGTHVVLSEDSAELVRRHFGEATEVRSGLIGRASPLSCARAEAAFGYRSRFVWSETRYHLDAE